MTFALTFEYQYSRDVPSIIQIQPFVTFVELTSASFLLTEEPA